jgi:hypothetical protein
LMCGAMMSRWQITWRVVASLGKVTNAKITFIISSCIIRGKKEGFVGYILGSIQNIARRRCNDKLSSWCVIVSSEYLIQDYATIAQHSFSWLHMTVIILTPVKYQWLNFNLAYFDYWMMDYLANKHRVMSQNVLSICYTSNKGQNQSHSAVM